MSDDSPWKPPVPGERHDDGAHVTPTVAPEASANTSPWSREAAGTVLAAVSTLPPPQQSTQATEPMLPPAATVASALAAKAAHHTPDPAAAAVEVEPSVGTTTAPRNRSPRFVALAVVAILAVGLAGLFAVRRFTGAAASGGSDADELGERLLDAIDGTDVLGMIDTLLPGERETLGQPFVDMVGELQRLEVLSADLDLADLAGFDIELSNRRVEVEPTNVADIVHVRLAADATAAVDGAAVPIGDLLTDNVPEDLLAEMRGTTSTSVESFEFELTAVQDDGRWYFSLWHSLAETARLELDDVPGIPATGVGAAGGASPEEALDRLVASIEELDVRSMIQLLDPAEAAALQRYAPLFLPDAEAAIAGFPGSIDVTEYDFSVTGEGSTRMATLDAVAVEIDVEGVHVALAFDGDCVRMSATDGFGEQSSKFCADDADAALPDLELGPEVEELMQAFTDAFADVEVAGLELRERDGEWFVSPVATSTEALLKVVRALDRGELERIIAAVPPAADAFADTLFGAFGEMPGELAADGVFDGSSSGVLGGLATDEVLPDGVPADDPPDGADPGSDASTVIGSSSTEQCYSHEAAAAAVDCFAEVLASGAAETWEVPVAMRFPECGLAEAQWTGELYTMPDAAFTALVSAAAPCFQDLVTRGEVDEWELPGEVIYLDCYEGRNWYAVFDDEAYNERVLACIGI